MGTRFPGPPSYNNTRQYMTKSFSLDVVKAADGWIITIRDIHAPPGVFNGNTFIVKDDENLNERIAAIIGSWRMTEGDRKHDRDYHTNNYMQPAPYGSLGSISVASMSNTLGQQFNEVSVQSTKKSRLLRALYVLIGKA